MPVDPDSAALQRFLQEELGVEGARSLEDVSPGWAITTTLWVWRGSGSGPPSKPAWYFLTIDGPVAAAIRDAACRPGKSAPRGYGSVRVTATIGATSWQTSLFPAKDAGGFLLPVKATVRRKEILAADQCVTVQLSLG